MPYFWLLFACLLCGAFAATAQERFTVQSSGRGMENAKQGAQIRQLQVRDGQQDSRIDAVEGDIAKIAAHAWKTISQCGVGGGVSGTGYKITWNPAGTGSWGCIQETDPTVKAFAKTDLPTCGAGQVLRSNGTQLSCTTSAGSAGFEVDPYVQDFARNTAYTINACAADELLTMTNKRLRCIKSRDLSITELDPTVQPFAKAALPVCGAGQVLTTATGSGGVTVLRCVTDTDGGYAELDPSVGTITNTKWCMAASGKIHCNQNPPVLTETDPTVKAFAKANLPTCAAGKVLTANGTALSCADAGAIPGGSDKHVQFNRNGVLTGHSGMTFDIATASFAVSGTATAIKGQASGTSGIGVHGVTPSTSGATYGVYGYTASTSGVGVRGVAAATTGVSYGGSFQTSSASGRAVYGSAGAATGDTRGGYFQVFSTSGRAVEGYAHATTGGTYGGYFTNASTLGRGVFGSASASTGQTYGVYGSASSPQGYGVYSSGRMHATKALTVADSVTATAYYQSSDRNLKENITPVQNPFALLNAIEGKHYTWKESKQPAYGVIAQEVEKVMPEAVKVSDEGTKTVEYGQLIAPLIEAVKQLEKRVQMLEAENAALKAAR